MPDSGTGTGTAIVCGASATGYGIAEPLPWTLLSLDRYSQILGIAPTHFNQGVSEVVLPLTNRCSDVWYKYSWQNADSVSRHDLAWEIRSAEREIADYMGWWPGPVWIEQDVKMYPRHHRPEVIQIGGTNVRGMGKSVKAEYGKLIEPGQRAVTFISSPNCIDDTLEFTDEDGDGFAETAVVTATVTTTDACEIKVYHYGYSGDMEWEIRPARSKTISSGTFTGVYWSWQFIDPELLAAFPGVDGMAAVNLDETVYVDTVDVYREYNDATANSCYLYWEGQPSALCTVCGGVGCTTCTLTEQAGCIHIRDAQRGIVVPSPGTYDEDDGVWDSAAWSVCRDPDQVKIYYQSGDYDQRFLKGRLCDPLSDWWALTIAMLATARLERPFCSCGNSQALAADWRTDLALAGEVSHNVPFELLDNPFGTRKGEVRAWQRVSRLAHDRLRGATAV